MEDLPGLVAEGDGEGVGEGSSDNNNILISSDENQSMSMKIANEHEHRATQQTSQSQTDSLLDFGIDSSLSQTIAPSTENMELSIPLMEETLHQTPNLIVGQSAHDSTVAVEEIPNDEQSNLSSNFPVPALTEQGGEKHDSVMDATAHTDTRVENEKKHVIQETIVEGADHDIPPRHLMTPSATEASTASLPELKEEQNKNSTGSHENKSFLPTTESDSHHQTYANVPGGKALPLITVSDDEQFHIHDEAVQLLKGYKTPIAIVAIAGKYRTGKSYLLNVLTGRPSGFEVGSTVNACTKGIWLWNQPKYDPERNLHIFFVDSEGLGSTTRSSTHDSRVFALSLLLSSYFIYNSRGVIDNQALEDLSLVANLTQVIHVKSGNMDENDIASLAQFFPSFLWVVRDFSLKLEDDKGNRITSNQYLENCLKQQTGFTEAIASKNRLRKLITTYFKDRECITLVRPAEDEHILKNLSSHPLSELRPEFQKQVKILESKVFSFVRAKQLMGQTLNGEMLITLAKTYIEALNSGGVPVINSAWTRVLYTQCQDAKREALAQYDALLLEELGRIPRNANRRRLAEKLLTLSDCLPLTFNEIDSCHEKSKAKVKEIYRSKLMDPYEATALEIGRALRDELRSRFKTLEAENYKISQQVTQLNITQMFDDLKKAHMHTNITSEDQNLNVEPVINFITGFLNMLKKFKEMIACDNSLSEDFLGPGAAEVINKFITNVTLEEMTMWSSNLADEFRDYESKMNSAYEKIQHENNELIALIDAKKQILNQQTQNNAWAEAEMNQRLEEEERSFKEELVRKEAEIARYENMINDLMKMHQTTVMSLRQKQDQLRKKLELERENVLDEQRKLGTDVNLLKGESESAANERLTEKKQLEDSLARQITHIRHLQDEIDRLHHDHASNISKKSIQFNADIQREKEKMEKEKRELAAKLALEEQRDDELRANELKKLREMLQSKQTTVEKYESNEVVASAMPQNNPHQANPTGAPTRKESFTSNNMKRGSSTSTKKKMDQSCKQS